VQKLAREQIMRDFALFSHEAEDSSMPPEGLPGRLNVDFKLLVSPRQLITNQLKLYK